MIPVEPPLIHSIEPPPTASGELEPSPSLPSLPSGGEVTGLIRAWQGGDRDAFDLLFAAIVPELRRLARWQLKGQAPNCSLQTDGLVNDLYLKLIAADRIEAQCRGQFFALAAMIIRRLLLDWANDRKAQKRGGHLARVEMESAELWPDERAAELLALDDALAGLKRIRPDLEALVVLRYFGGGTIEETAKVMQITVGTANYQWTLAKAWLERELSVRQNGGHDGTAAEREA